MNQPAHRYRSYLLRIWPEESAFAVQWRVSLTSVDNHQQLGFPSLEAAFTFLRAQTQQWQEPGPAERQSENVPETPDTNQ